MDIQKAKENLEKKGYRVTVFETSAEAVSYLTDTVKGKTIGFGGSQTLTDLNLRNVLAEENTVYVPDFPPEGEDFFGVAYKTVDTDCFFLSANAVSENGEIVNIDGEGNRLAGALFGHKKVYFVIGINKFGGTLEESVCRARNIAAPKNCLRLGRKTPCAQAVRGRLEKTFREKFHVEGPSGLLEWQEFIESLSTEELGTHCYDCGSPERICRAVSIHLTNLFGADTEVILINRQMGF